jgi:hypothetical protein
MSVINALKTALTSRLAGDASLTSLQGGTAVYDTQAPQGADAPFVIFQKVSAVPSYTMGQRAFDNTVVMVKSVTRGGSKALGGSVAERIDALLDDLPLTISGATNLYLRRQQDIDYQETDKGVPIHHIGATYSVWVQ